MRISDWSSDVCSSDLAVVAQQVREVVGGGAAGACLQPAQRLEQALFDFGEVAAQWIVWQGAVGAERCERVAQASGRIARPRRWNQIGRASCRERVCQSV